MRQQAKLAAAMFGGTVEADGSWKAEWDTGYTPWFFLQHRAGDLFNGGPDYLQLS